MHRWFCHPVFFNASCSQRLILRRLRTIFLANRKSLRLEFDLCDRSLAGNQTIEFSWKKKSFHLTLQILMSGSHFSTAFSKGVDLFCVIQNQLLPNLSWCPSVLQGIWVCTVYRWKWAPTSHDWHAGSNGLWVKTSAGQCSHTQTVNVWSLFPTSSLELFRVNETNYLK